MRKKPYKGDWFAVPIDSGYVISRIAGVGRRCDVLLGYFFEPLFKSLPTRHDVEGLSPAAAFNIGKFGDGEIVNDGWPIIDSPRLEPRGMADARPRENDAFRPGGGC